MDTAETESNYTRINLLLVKGGTMVAKRLFLQRVKDLSPQGTVLTVEEFLSTNKAKLLKSYTGKHKEHTLYPTNGRTNVDEWDLHLLCFVLQEVCDLKSIHRKDVEKLQKMRNKLCHLPEPTLSQDDFEERLEKIKIIFQRSQRLIKDKSFEDEIDALVAKYEHEPIPINEIVKFNHNFLRSELERTELLGNQKKMMEMASEMKQYILTLLDLVEQNNRMLRHDSSPEVPGMNIIINVLNCTKDEEKTVLDELLELFNKRISQTESNDIESLTNEAWHKVSEEVQKTFKGFLEKGRHLVKVEKKCLLLRVQCDSIPTFTKLVRDCLDGSILNQLHGLLTAVKSLEGYNNVEFRHDLQEEDIVNTLGVLVNNLQRSLPKQKYESALMMTPRDNTKRRFGESEFRGSSYMLSLTVFPDTLTQLQELKALWNSGAFEEALTTVQEAVRNKSPDFTHLTIAARLLELEPEVAFSDLMPESNEKTIARSTKRSNEDTFRRFPEGRPPSKPSSFTQDRKKTRKINDDSDDLGKGNLLCMEKQDDTPDVWKTSWDSIPATTCINKVDEKAISTSTEISHESPVRNSDDEISSSGPSSFTRDNNKKKNDDSNDLGRGIPSCQERQNAKQRSLLEDYQHKREPVQQVTDDLKQQDVGNDPGTNDSDVKCIDGKNPDKIVDSNDLKGDWQRCLALGNKKFAYRALQKHLLPDQRLLNKLTKHFGRKSTILSEICKRISSYLAAQEGSIYDVWPAVKVNCDDIVFVVIVKSKWNDYRTQQFDKTINYSYVMRSLGDVSCEGKEVINSSEFKQGSTRLSPADYVVLQQSINDNNVELMKRHTRLMMISISPVRSKGHASNFHKVAFEPCLVLYVLIKGFIPINEDPFETHYSGVPVDVREGMFKLFTGPAGNYHADLKSGCQIVNYSIGTLGGFVDYPGWGTCGLTCAHVVLNPTEMKSLAPKWDNDMDLEVALTGQTVYQPDSSHDSHAVGKVIKAIYREGGDVESGIDIAVFHILQRHPVLGDFPDNKDGSHSTISYDSGKTADITRLGVRDVYKFGAETDLTTGSVVMKGDTFSVRTYKKYIVNNEYDVKLHKLIEIESKPGMSSFAEQGDSGALVFCEGGNKELICVGVVEGGTSHNTCVVMPILPILEQLNLVSLKSFEINRMEQKVTQTGHSLAEMWNQNMSSAYNAIESRITESERTTDARIGRSEQAIETRMTQIEQNLQNLVQQESTKTVSEVRNLLQNFMLQISKSSQPNN